MELGPNQKLWVEKLRSGEFKQGLLYLNSDNKFCCLGVACEVFNALKPKFSVGPQNYFFDSKQVSVVESSAPKFIVDKLKLRDHGGHVIDHMSLSCMNDTGWSFEQIANFIEANPEKVFTESA